MKYYYDPKDPSDGFICKEEPNNYNGDWWQYPGYIPVQRKPNLKEADLLYQLCKPGTLCSHGKYRVIDLNLYLFHITNYPPVTSILGHLNRHQVGDMCNLGSDNWLIVTITAIDHEKQIVHCDYNVFDQ